MRGETIVTVKSNPWIALGFPCGVMAALIAVFTVFGLFLFWPDHSLGYWRIDPSKATGGSMEVLTDILWIFVIFVPHSMYFLGLYFVAGRNSYVCDAETLVVSRGKRTVNVIACASIEVLDPGPSFGWRDLIWTVYLPDFITGFVLHVRNESGELKIIELPTILVWGKAGLNEPAEHVAKLIFDQPQFVDGAWKSVRKKQALP